MSRPVMVSVVASNFNPNGISSDDHQYCKYKSDEYGTKPNENIFFGLTCSV